MQTPLSFTMRACNHTLQWLSNKDPEEKDRTLNLAQVKNQYLMEKYKVRAEPVKLKKKERILAKQRETRSSRKTIKKRRM